MALQPRTCNAGRLAHARFRLFRVRSPLLAESLLISLPEGTEMFHFPSFAARSLLYSAPGSTDCLGSGFPIRKSTDRRSFAAPRGLSQLGHVLHRLLAPRHPPNALSSLTTKPLAGRRPRGAPCPRARHRSGGARDPQAGGLFATEFTGPRTGRCVLSTIEYPRLLRPLWAGRTGPEWPSKDATNSHAIRVFALRSSYSIINRILRWRIRGSNPRPQACKARALPAELIPRL